MLNYEKKEIIIVFGEIGSGKNYWGDKISKEVNYQFFDGDDYLFHGNQVLFHEMYYLNIFCSEIINRASVSSYGLVVAQSLYNDQDRINLKKLLEANGEFMVNFFWICPSWKQNLKQIFSRRNGFLGLLYWLMNKPFFQKPTHKHSVIK